jgi:putative peptidoglycan lipid II flippase
VFSFANLTGAAISRLNANAASRAGFLGWRTLNASILVTALVVLVKIVSVAKEILVARRFGAADSLDAFYVALIVPNFLGAILVSSLNAALIPTYIELRETQSRQAAQQLFANIGACYLAMSLCICLLLFGTNEWLLPVLGSGFGNSKLALTREIFYILVGTMCVGGMSGLWQAALNAHERYGFTALAPICNPLLVVMSLLMWARGGIFALAFGVLLGSLGELALSGYVLTKDGISLIPRWSGLDQASRRVLVQYVPLIAGGILMSSNNLVDQSFAAMLGSGSVSALNYANKLVSVIMTVGLSSSIILLPNLSRLSANSDWAGIRSAITTYTWIIALGAILATLLLVSFSEPLVAMLFQRGAFTRNDTHLVAGVQTLLCLQLPFHAVGMLYVRALSSLRRNDILMWGTLLTVSANAGFDVLFMKFLGLPGIALSTSVVYALSYCYLRYMLFRVLDHRSKVSEYCPTFAQVEV